jgi:hypothetical protein
MLCTNCKAGADKRASLRDTNGVDTATAAWTAFVESTTEEANALHSACTGGEQGCGCQHRGTPAATHYADRNQARITSPEVSA